MMFSRFQTNRVPESYRDLLLFMAGRPGPRLMVAVLACAVLYKSTLGGWSVLDLVIIGFILAIRGILEWLIHACLYHGWPVPLLGFRLRGDIHEMHLKHHRDPLDYDTFLLTSRGVSVASVVTLAFWWPLTGLDLAVSLVFAVIMVLFIIEVVHLMAHSRIYPRNRFLARMLALHRRHHQCDDGNWMGVSSSLGDRLFGTYPKE